MLIDWSQYSAVSFDVGETLLRPYPSFAISFRRTCLRNGLRLTNAQASRVDAEATARSADYQRRGLRYSASTESSREFWLSIYRETLHSLGVEAAIAERLANALYADFTRSGAYRLFADARPALRRARRRGLKVGILSNWEAWLARLLSELDLTRHLDFVTISALAGHEKPAPDIFLAAARSAGHPPDRIVHIGDSLHHDVAGARAVGITPILVDRSDRHPEADCIRVRSLSELGL